MMLARLSAHKRIRDAGIDAKLISTVHDSICWDGQAKDAQQITDICYSVFDDLPKNIYRLFRYNWETPMTCECKGGPNMKEQTKIQRSC